MIDCKNLLLTLDQIDDMKHAIGLYVRKLRKNQWKLVAYRNYFTTTIGGSKSWGDLCVKGLAERAECIEDHCIIYRVTPDGMKVLEYVFDVIVEVK